MVIHKGIKIEYNGTLEKENDWAKKATHHTRIQLDYFCRYCDKTKENHQKEAEG